MYSCHKCTQEKSEHSLKNRIKLLIIDIPKHSFSRVAGFGAALVLAHLEQYHRPQDNTKLFLECVLHTVIEEPLFHHFGGS